MSERQKQRLFLKKLMGFAGKHCGHELHERMAKAEHDERSVRCAVILVGSVALLSLLGLAYAAVLLPEFFDNTTPFLVKLFCALGLGSFICLIAFLVCWFWYRGVSNKLYDECRQIVTDVLQARFGEQKSEFSESLTAVDFADASARTESEHTSAAVG